MSYCIYLRKSRTDTENKHLNKEEADTDALSRHEQTLLEFAKKQGYSITQIYREVVSGETIAARPQMQKMLEDITAGLYDGVICMEIERLARGNSIDQGIIQQTFKFSNTLIITPNKIYNPADEYDETFMELGLFLSRQEYKTIKRRLMTGRTASVNEGKYLGTIPAFGYKRVKLENQKGWTLAVNEEEAKVVRKIFELYTEFGYGQQKIARYLNESGIPTRKNALWSNQTVGAILKNPVYCGKIRWNYHPETKRIVDGKIIKFRRINENCTIVDGLHPPIVSEETFGKVESVKKKNYIPRLRNDKELKNPLAGLLKCGKCLKTMVRRPYKKPAPIYYCENQMCGNVSSYCSKIEEKLIAALEYWLSNYKINDNANQANTTENDTSFLENSINKFKSELSVYENQRNNLYDLLEQKIYTTEIFTERNKKINDKINDIRLKLAELEQRLNHILKYKSPCEDLCPPIENIINVLKNTDNASLKNRALKEILEKIEYRKDKGGRGTDPYDFELVIYPKIPYKKRKD